MNLLERSAFIIAFFVLVESPTRAAAAEAPRALEARLVAFLTGTERATGEMERILGILKRVQVVTLHYRKNSPIGPEDEEQEIRKRERLDLSGSALVSASIPVYPDGKRYPEIRVVFNAFHYGTTPGQWLETMKKPIQTGYDLKTASIVLIPDMEVQRQSLARSQAVVGAFMATLERLKPEFRQLQTLGSGSLKRGTWKDNRWPDYPEFLYRQDIAWRGKRAVTSSREWCEISLQFRRLTGLPGQPAGGARGRKYPMQGLSLDWCVSSADPRFNERINRTIEELLEPIDDFEKEIAKKMDGATTGSTPTR